MASCACPMLTGWGEPTCAPPSKKMTVPPALTAPEAEGETVAVTVTVCPAVEVVGVAEMVVPVAFGVIVAGAPAEAGRKFESPE